MCTKNSTLLAKRNEACQPISPERQPNCPKKAQFKKLAIFARHHKKKRVDVNTKFLFYLCSYKKSPTNNGRAINLTFNKPFRNGATCKKALPVL